MLCAYKSENQKHTATCGSDISHWQKDDFLPDVKVGILDLRPTSQQGKRWNFSDRKDQCEILWPIRNTRPKLVIGYGRCILFCTVLYHEQRRRGAWFLHDLSGDASQLSLPCMIRLECRLDVFHALGDARDRRDGERVSFLTNSPHIARRVEGSKRQEDLDSEICEGLRQQVGDVGHASSTMHLASGTQARPFDLTLQILRRRSRRREGGQIVQELNSIREGKYWDDVPGGWLDPVLIRKAREEEMQYVKKHAVYEKVSTSQCWKETRKNTIKTGGADTNKGTSKCPNIRSRWVAKEYNTRTQADLFSATSPLEGVKLVISEGASSNQKETVLLVIDVRRAYFYAKARCRVYIELLAGDGGGPGSLQCGLLRKSLYGTRDAQNWECELGGFMEEIGLRRGQASTCLCSEEARGISASVHGDDVTVKALREDAEWLIRKFKERNEIKTQMIGEAADLDKQLQILNRTVRWSSRGLWIEADPRHVQEVIKV